MKKKKALMLAAVLTLATVLMGCGGKNIAGDYSGVLGKDDFALATGESWDIENFNSDEWNLPCSLHLGDDGKFELVYEYTTSAALFRDLYEEKINKELDMDLEENGMTRADFTDELAIENGYESAADLFQQVIDEQMKEIDDLLTSGWEDEVHTGSYWIMFDKLYLTSSGDDTAFEYRNGEILEDGSINLVMKNSEGPDLVINFKLNE